ncbi:unnamed protein product, partial [Callosobruchus maculatus]
MMIISLIFFSLFFPIFSKVCKFVLIFPGLPIFFLFSTSSRLLFEFYRFFGLVSRFLIYPVLFDFSLFLPVTLNLYTFCRMIFCYFN